MSHRRGRWYVLLPPFMVQIAGGIEQLKSSYERCAERGVLPAGCVGFELVRESMLPEERGDVYTCVQFRV